MVGVNRFASLTSSAEDDTGWKNVLWKSMVTEAAGPIPSGRWTRRGAQSRPPPVGGVDVQPHVRGFADLGDGLERVDDPEIRGSGGGDDGHRDGPVRLDRQQARSQCLGVHASGG